MFVVPDSLREAINERLDAALSALPEDDRIVAEKDRDFLYSQLLDAFNKYGEIPDFSLVPNLPEFRVVRTFTDG